MTIGTPSARGGHPPGGGGHASLATARRGEELARIIAAEIIRPGLGVGADLGSEASLTRRHQVSRDILREAIRLLEHHGLASARRGRHGGLLVTAPTPAAIADAFAVNLAHRQGSPDELLEVRKALGPAAVGLATERLEAGDHRRLRQLMTEPDTGWWRRLPGLFSPLTGDPVTVLMLGLLDHLGFLYGLFPHVSGGWKGGVDDDLHDQGLAVLEAVLDGDGDGAHQQMELFFDLENGYVSDKMEPGLRADRLFHRFETPARLGPVVAGRILASLGPGRWQAGRPLGTEAALMARLAVSRGTLREAIRLLEHVEVAAMRRGTHGGLEVTASSIRPLQVAICLHLSVLRPVSLDIEPVMRLIEPLVVQRLVRRRPPKEPTDSVRPMRRSKPISERDGSGLTESRGLLALSEACGSKVLHLLTVLLVEIHRQHTNRQARWTPIG